VKKSTFIEMRKYPRIKLELPIILTFFYEGRSVICPGLCLDVSLSGIGVAMYKTDIPCNPEEFPVNGPVKLEIKLPSLPDEIIAGASLKWKRDTTDNSGVIIGLEFELAVNAEAPFILYSYAKRANTVDQEQQS